MAASKFSVAVLFALAALLFAATASGQDAKHCVVLEEAQDPYNKKKTAMSMLNTCSEPVTAFWCYSAKGDAQCKGAKVYRMKTSLVPNKRKFNSVSLLKGTHYRYGACFGKSHLTKLMDDGSGRHVCLSEVQCSKGKKVSYELEDVKKKGKALRFHFEGGRVFSTKNPLAGTEENTDDIINRLFTDPTTKENVGLSTKEASRQENLTLLYARLYESACGEKVSPSLSSAIITSMQRTMLNYLKAKRAEKMVDCMKTKSQEECQPERRSNTGASGKKG